MKRLSYSDHHIFSIDDLKDISKKFEKIKAPNKFILTTEKDAVRLMKFKEQLADIPLYVLPVKHKFLFNEEQDFNKLVIDFIAGFKNTQLHETKKIQIKTSIFAGICFKRQT